METSLRIKLTNIVLFAVLVCGVALFSGAMALIPTFLVMIVSSIFTKLVFLWVYLVAYVLTSVFIGWQVYLVLKEELLGRLDLEHNRN